MQRFGQVYRQAGNMLLFTCSPWIVAFGRPTFEVYGKAVSPFAYYYQGTRFVNVYEKSRLDEVAYAALEKLGTPQRFESVYRKWLEIARRLDEQSWSIYQGNLASFESMWRELVSYWGHSVFIDCFDAGVDFLEMSRIASEHDLSREDIQLLTTPTELSYLQDYERELSNAAISGNFSEFLRTFYWYPTNYVDFGCISEEKANALASAAKREAQKTLRLLSAQVVSLEDRQSALLDDKGLSENPLWLYQKLVAWRDLRKRLNFTALFGFDVLCRQWLKEQGIDPELFGAVWPFEVLEGRVLEKTLKARRVHGVLVWADVDSFDFLVGPAGAKKLAELDVGPKSEKLELRGQPACLGRVIASVRIVNDPSEDFHAGEILVTAMTRPEFVPLMKKAVGIITDEGGITSHAAVVSRELNKPCIVGTQVATRKLRTGDVVELDAFHGLVRSAQLIRSP
ncbi:hypothetical protein HY572_00730 [Candidatus Micrarchaeota archaeon]|nr:hypothetical protein [Candidatus Micrarchaeota archaeon]